MNLYGFVSNNVLKFWDYLGLEEEGAYPCKCDGKKINLKIREMTQKAVELTQRDHESIPDRAIREHPLTTGREWGGIICCNIKTGNVSATGPINGGGYEDEAGFWSAESIDLNKAPGCYTLGPDWRLAGAYHSHPTESRFSATDIQLTHTYNIPLGMGFPQNDSSVSNVNLVEAGFTTFTTPRGEEIPNFPTGIGWSINEKGSLTQNPSIISPPEESSGRAPNLRQ